MSRPRLALWALTFLVLSSAAQASPIDGAVAGHVRDSNGHPISGATVSLIQLSRATTTGPDGSFRFSALSTGRYTVSARYIGYEPAAVEIVVAESDVDVTITLQSTAFRVEPVTVTATRAPSDQLTSPLPMSVLTAAQIPQDGGISLAHSIDKLPGVRSVTSGEQIGKPMIRGLFGPRVLVLADGSRMEDYSWSDEDGPSIDARMAERIEVIRGPASVLYGSDAMGGVVNVIPAELPSSADGSRIRNEAIEGYVGSNDAELGSAGMVEGASGRYGWRVMATGRFSQNYQTPHGEEPNSSFWNFNGDAALGIREGDANTTLRLSHYGGEMHLLESSGPEAADPTGGPVRQTEDDRFQVSHDYVNGTFRLETKGQWQTHGLTEVSDDCVPVPPATTCVKVKDQVAFALTLNTGTVDVLAHHVIGSHVTGTAGVSGMYQLSNSSGPITLVPNATVNSAAAFAFEQAAFGPVTFTGGVRADTRGMTADANTALQEPSDTRRWNSTTADLGLLYHPFTPLAFVVNGGTGWRAPTLFDLYANGPNLAEARFEIGTPLLAPEHANDLDASVRWSDNNVRAEFTAFNNWVNSFIFVQPTPATRDSLQIFLHTQTNAHLWGGEASLEYQVAEPLTLRASHDIANGQDLLQGQPLPLMPPQRTILGAELRRRSLSWAREASLSTDVVIVQQQDRLNPQDYQTPGYTLVNVDAEMERTWRGWPMRVDLDVRNALNTAYKDFLSRYKTFAYGPGVNVIAKVSLGAF